MHVLGIVYRFGKKKKLVHSIKKLFITVLLQKCVDKRQSGTGTGVTAMQMHSMQAQAQARFPQQKSK